MGVAEMTGASFEHSLGGQTFVFGPIGPVELGKCEAWVKQEKLKVALPGLPASESNELRVMLIKDILNMSAVELKEEMRKPASITHMLWLAVVKVTPDVKPEVFDRAVAASSQAECDVLADKLAGMGGEGKDSPPVNSVPGSGKA